LILDLDMTQESDLGIKAMEKVSIGLRAKTARAIAVVMAGPVDAPRVLKRTELILADPRAPATSYPYHEVMELPWAQAQIAVQETLKLIEVIATTALTNLAREIEADGLKIGRVGIVGAGDRDLDKLGSAHIRAHAAEGVWFRRVLELATEACGLPKRTFDERRLNETAAVELRHSTTELATMLTDLGSSVGRPWRADEKAAAVAAWLALSSKERRKR